jgi:ribonuclease Z
MKALITIALLVVFLGGLAIGINMGANNESLISRANAAVDEAAEPLVSPVKARELDFYVPNTEDLAPDEMRVIACGTGMPTTRASQAAACFLVELGNGDKFIFDIGSGSAERISSLQIPYDFLDKIFIGHLHGDHFGALGELFIGGALMGRHVPLQVWGPSGPVP